MATEKRENVEPKVKKAECSNCGGVRNCNIIGHHNEGSSDEHFWWNRNWFLLECRGCDHVFVQTVSTDSESYDYWYDEHGETQSAPMETVSYWPAREKRKRPDWMTDSGIVGVNHIELDEMLLEVYAALANDLRVLAAIGIRTTFDVAAELLGINPDQPFKRKLEELVAAGHIGKLELSRLEILVDGGSASAHRGWRPKHDDLTTMMDILELFIHDAFVAPSKRSKLDEAVEKVKGRVPKRKDKKDEKVEN
jgi:hypothetical protein